MKMKTASKEEAMEFSFDIVFHDNMHPLGMHHPWHKIHPYYTTFEKQDELYTYCPDTCWAMPPHIRERFPKQCKPYNIPELLKCENVTRPRRRQWWRWW